MFGIRGVPIRRASCIPRVYYCTCCSMNLFSSSSALTRASISEARPWAFSRSRLSLSKSSVQTWICASSIWIRSLSSGLDSCRPRGLLRSSAVVRANCVSTSWQRCRVCSNWIRSWRFSSSICEKCSFNISTMIFR